MTKVLTFTGIEIYDVEIYLAMILKTLRQHVLLIDNSSKGALVSCCSSTNLEENGKPADYYGVTMVRNIAGIPEEFGWAIVDYGMSGKRIDCASQNYFVIDYQKHNVDLLKYVSPDQINGIILRDRISNRVTAKSVEVDVEGYGHNPDSMIFLEDTYEDLSSRAMRQYGNNERFDRVSTSMQQCFVRLLSDSYSEKEVLNAFKIAARRK